MNCYAVFLKSNNKQLRVFHYSYTITGDDKRAEQLAIDFANSNHNSGYPCIVEFFGMCDVGELIHDTDSKQY
jgi:hypothetical protein